MSITPLQSGALKPSSTWGEYNNIYFAIQQALAQVQTATIVEIMACTNAGDDSPVGFVDVKPTVNQIDGNAEATPHGTIYNIPYLRIQGGTDAIILDPKVGDLGIAVFASRDISKVKTTKAAANPGSFRRYDFSDGMYLGGLLNGTPLQYLRFASTGIELVSPTKITLRAPAVEIDGVVTMSESLAVTGVVTAGPNSINLSTHKHTSAPSGSPTSPPLP